MRYLALALILASCGPDKYKIEIDPSIDPAWLVDIDVRVATVYSTVKNYTQSKHTLDGWTIRFINELLIDCGDTYSLGCCYWTREEIIVPVKLYDCVERSSLGHEIAHVMYYSNSPEPPPAWFDYKIDDSRCL